MRSPLIIVGCGGFGREVWSIVRAINVRAKRWAVEGFVDDDPSPESLERVSALGSVVLGTLDELAHRAGSFAVVIAVGSPRAREAIHERLAGPSIEFPPLVHPESTIGANVDLREGVVVGPGARISTNIRLGRHVQVDQNVTIGHDASVGDFSRLNPMSCIGGSVRIGRAALIGANATVLQGLRIGDGATVGAAACVTREVGTGAVVKGVPAR